MRLSIIQPEIVRRNVSYNVQAIQRLIDASEGDLLVLPEYALTGPPRRDEPLDVREWARESAAASKELNIPPGKHLLVTALVESDGHVYNCAGLSSGGLSQCKLFPGQAEVEAGIAAGCEQPVFELFDRRFKIIIGRDLCHADEIQTDGLDFALWVSRFTNRNYAQAMAEAKHLSSERRLRIFASSLVGDRYIGHSAYIDSTVRLSLREREGILEAILS
jgi:predicted amidohydrolase